MNWKGEVIADNSGEWCGNALVFKTKEEAEKYIHNLMMKWFAVRETRVIETPLEANFEWIDGKGEVRLLGDTNGI